MILKPDGTPAFPKKPAGFRAVEKPSDADEPTGTGYAIGSQHTRPYGAWEDWGYYPWCEAEELEPPFPEAL